MTTAESVQEALGINEVQTNKFYSRGSRKNNKHKSIVFVIEIDLEKKLITTILIEDMFSWVNDIDKKLTLGYTRPFEDFNFYPLDEKVKIYVEKEKKSFVGITEKWIDLRKEDIQKLEDQKNILNNSI